MNTVNQNSLSSMICMQDNLNCENYSPIDNTDDHILDMLDSNGEQIIVNLSTHLDKMQENFVNMLDFELNKKGIILEDRLHFNLSHEYKLIIESENDNDIEKIGIILSEKPELQDYFKEMAKLAMLEHGIEIAWQANLSKKSEDIAKQFSNIFTHYHMFAKGSLSHFCVK